MDFVFEEILETEDVLELEKTFICLGIKTIYFIREIKSKLDLKKEYILPEPSSKGLVFKKAYLFYDISLLSGFKDQENSVLLAQGGDISQNSIILSKNRGFKILLNPLSTHLSFDTSSSNLCKENNIKIAFDLNYIKHNPYSSIKQMNFILRTLIKEKINIFIFSCARRKDQLIDPNITFCFLLNFGIPQETITRFLEEGEI